MKFLFNKKFILVIGLLIAGYIGYRIVSPGKKVDFSADVKPIINKNVLFVMAA
jgi:hypothetical protein